jgi:hypothetical protein
LFLIKKSHQKEIDLMMMEMAKEFPEHILPKATLATSMVPNKYWVAIFLKKW